MDDVRLHLADAALDGIELDSTGRTDAHAGGDGADAAPLRFPAGGVYGLDRSHIEAAEDALDRVSLALQQLELLADATSSAETIVHRLTFGDDDEPPRAA